MFPIDFVLKMVGAGGAGGVVGAYLRFAEAAFAPEVSISQAVEVRLIPHLIHVASSQRDVGDRLLGDRPVRVDRLHQRIVPDLEAVQPHVLGNAGSEPGGGASDVAVEVRSQLLAVDAAQLMEQHRIRRLPIVDAEGRCCAILSQADIALKAPQRPAARVLRTVSEPHRAAP